jgi:flagellar hook-basal body complex protein FliE
MPLDAITAVGPEWEIAAPGLEGDLAAAPGTGAPVAGGPGFGGMLADRLGALAETQQEAAAAGQALATGTATDPAQVVMAVERAQLSMQLAAQLRDKGLQAFQEIFRTQV